MKNYNGTVVQTVHAIRKKAVGILAVFICLVATNQISYGQCTPTAFNIKGTPTITGTAGAVGTKYRYANVLTGVDIEMQIDSVINGAVLSNIDSIGGTAGTASPIGYDNAWQPTLAPNGTTVGKDGYIRFKISFFSNGTNTPVFYNCLSLLAVDIDGDGDTATNNLGTLKEYVEALNPYSFAGQSTGAHLSYNALSGIVRAQAATVQVIPSTDSSKKYGMSLFRYKNLSSFRYTIGYSKARSATSPNRQFCLFFNIQTTFPSAFSRYFDTDGDGISDINDPTDLDDDNDGITDLAEYPSTYPDPLLDADGDGLANYEDPTPGTVAQGIPATFTWIDTNGDGVNDRYDADKDGIINSLDLDSDNDGIPDIVEAGGVDTDGDGLVDGFTDTNGNGLADRYDPAVTNGVAIRNLDTDGDSIPNALDLDSDNDGIPDVVEVGGVDANGDGIIDGYSDVDGDGFDDRVDGDVGNDGTAENTANALLLTGTYNSTTNPIPVNYIQGLANTDARGLPNPYDLDSDDDGIADVIEAGGTDANYDGKIDYINTFAANDTDGDGFIDSVDGSISGSNPILKTGADTDGDGKADSYLTADNADGTGPANPYDLDSDDDGVPDLIESGGVDTDGDGRISPNTDVNANGWLDSYDPTLATPGTGVNIRLLDANGSTAGGAIFDFDGDGIPNYLDLDSDNDGIPDIIEQGGADVDNNGKVDVYADIDNDGFADIYDPRNNNTGAPTTALGTALITAATASSTNNIATVYSTGANFDGTGLINMLDLDADDDGILDVRESGLTESSTTEGIAAGSTTATGWSATVDALAALNLRNTDGVGKPNYLDIDSDDDGIVDNIEGQSTAGYVLPSGVDADYDGIDDAYDNVTTAFAGNGTKDITPVNTDGTDVPDYYDLDSDNDGYPDFVEGHDFVGDNKPHANTNTKNGVPGGTIDADGDGLLDGYDNNTASVDPTNKAGTTTVSSLNYPNIDAPATTERDWREVANTDKDGVVGNITDIDDDNDGITDVVECGGYDPLGDADADGIPNYLDPTPGAGLPAFVDVNGDRINDAYDADLDGIINSLDLDSDNDGIADIVEAGGIDSNGDGMVDTFVDVNGNGLADTYDGAVTGGIAISNLDTDGDGIPNSRDLDSDNDGIPDLIEAGGVDANKDGIIDAGNAADTDGDGFADSVDGDVGNDGVAEGTAKALIITSTTGTNGRPASYPRANADANGLPNPYDLDSDDDGIADIVEAGGIDANGDGRVDYTGTFAANDADGDGLINTYDINVAGVSIANLDTDGDGIANYKDLDSDNDGIPDIIEAGGTDANNNGKVDNTTDADNDGLADIVDGDIGNDGTVEGLSKVLIYTSAAGATAGVPASYPRANMDGMGLPNPYDLDSDGDGILDTRESGLLKDLNNDGVLNTTDNATYVDADGNGWVDIIAAIGSTTLSLTNTDSRGGANYLDIDADDDGITDNIEGQPTLSYKLPLGTDVDNDGIDDAYDNNTGAFGGAANNGITPENTDGADVADYIDTDSDNDGMSDVREAVGNINYTITNFTDTDMDGLLDVFDIFNMLISTTNLHNNVTLTYMGALGTTSGPVGAGSNVPLYKSSSAANAERAYRNVAVILPVKLISFTATYSNKVSNIGWTIANEDGHEHYILERSIDANTFQAVSSTVAKGTATSNYTYADNAVPAANVVYYRLQIVNADGSISYSKVVAIRLNADKLSLSIYPNPVVDQVSVSFASTATQAVNVKVYNMQGAQVMAQAYKAQTGTNTLQLNNWNKLPAGDYLIEVSNENFKLTHKLSHVH